jgi:hypothetical protein
VPVVERGTASREGIAGWITVKCPATTALLDRLADERRWCRWRVDRTRISRQHRRRRHVSDADGCGRDLMYRSSWLSPTGLPTARELYHAAIECRRPIGNVDPDTDPDGTVNRAPMSAR